MRTYPFELRIANTIDYSVSERYRPGRRRDIRAMGTGRRQPRGARPRR